METKAVTINGKTQVITLPEKFWFKDGEPLTMNKIGHVLMIVPKDHVRDVFDEAAEGISDDFMIDDYPEEYFQKKSGEA